MDLNLRPPSVWSVTLTFSASTIMNNASNYIGRNIKAYKSLNTSVFCINMGNNPSHWNCSHWIRYSPDFCYIWCWHVSVHYSLYCQWSSFEINGGDTEVSCRGCSLFSVSVSCCNYNFSWSGTNVGVIVYNVGGMTLACNVMLLFGRLSSAV